MNSKKTICFFIFGTGAANGGHYRSLQMISEALLIKYDVIIINMGYTYSDIIKSSIIKSYFVFFNGINIINAINKTKKIFENVNINFLHAFDYNSYLFVRILSQKIKIPYFMTKCGGPTPKGYFPYVSSLVLFSNEDYNYFMNNSKYKNSSIVLLPNRMKQFSLDKKKIAKLKDDYSLLNKIVLLRICRICSFYYQSLIQSINLVNELSKCSDNNVKLLIIGNIQDQKIYEKIKIIEEHSDNVIIITDKDYTNNAKEIIGVADIVIGTGRGFMEACSQSKIMMVPANNSKYPVLITKDNFNIAFEKNFSERVSFNENEISKNFNKIKKCIDNKELFEKTKIDSLEWYNYYFSLDNAIEDYYQMYEKSTFKKDKCFDVFFHCFFFIRKNVGAWYRMINTPKVN